MAWVISAETKRVVNRVLIEGILQRLTEEAAHIFDVCTKPHWASSQR